MNNSVFHSGWCRRWDRRPARILPITLVLLLAAGCAGAPDEAVDAADAAAGPDLITSFNVDVTGDSVRFSLLVSHGEPAPVVLDFATAQRFDFQVLAPGGATAWQWSADQTFAQAMVSDTLAPMEPMEWTAWWQPTGLSGEYTAVARVLAIEHEVRLETEIELSDR